MILVPRVWMVLIAVNLVQSTLLRRVNGLQRIYPIMIIVIVIATCTPYQVTVTKIINTMKIVVCLFNRRWALHFLNNSITYILFLSPRICILWTSRQWNRYGLSSRSKEQVIWYGGELQSGGRDWRPPNDPQRVHIHQGTVNI